MKIEVKLKLTPLSSIKVLIEEEKVNRLQKTIDHIESWIIACGGKADVFLQDDEKDIIISALEDNGYKVKNDRNNLYTVSIK